MRRTQIAVAVPDDSRAYGNSTDATGIARDILLELTPDATDGDAVAVFATAQPITEGTVAKAFDAADPTTWPACCWLIGVVRGREVKSVPADAWGPNVLAMRIEGSTLISVNATGEGLLGVVSFAPPQVVGDHSAAIDVSTIEGWTAVAFDTGAAVEDMADVYVSGDATITEGSGAPPARFVGSITGRDRGPLRIPADVMAGRVLARRRGGTAARTILCFGALEGDGGGGGMQSVPNLAALRALATGPLPLGTPVFVETLRDYYVLSIDPGSLDYDDFLVIETPSGYVWLRQEVASPTWAAQQDWYIDSTENGNDENDGSAEHPVSGWPEIQRRIGRLQSPMEAIVVHVAAADAGGRAWIVDVHPKNMIYFRGDFVAQAANGVITAIQTGDFLTNKDWRFTNQAGEISAPESQFAFRVTAGANTGAFAHVSRNLGGGTIRTAPWGILSEDGFSLDSASPSNLDPIQLVRMTPFAQRLLVMGGTVVCQLLEMASNPYRSPTATLILHGCTLIEEGGSCAPTEADNCQWTSQSDMGAADAQSVFVRCIHRCPVWVGGNDVLLVDSYVDSGSFADFANFNQVTKRTRVLCRSQSGTAGVAVYSDSATSPGVYVESGSVWHCGDGMFGAVGSDGVQLRGNATLLLLDASTYPRMTVGGGKVAVKLGDGVSTCAFNASLPQADAQGWGARYIKGNY